MALNLGTIKASIGLNTAPLKAGVIQSKAMLAGLGTSMSTGITGASKKAEAGLAGLSTKLGSLGAVGGKAGGALTGLGSSIGALGTAGIAAAAVVVLAGGLTKCVQAAMEAQKVMAETNALLKTTGGVANITASEIEKLSTAIMMKTGYDDEAVQSGANMMLTFRQVRDEAGKNNDIYTQSIPLVADLARKMGLDMPQAALKLGKALNDPVKGLTNLRRFGIMFTDSQEAMIKKLMATGDILGAQKIILEEVKGEMGGVAEAYGKTLPGQIDIAKGAFENLMEAVGKPAIPAFTESIKNLVSVFKLLETLKVPEAMGQIIKYFADARGTIQQVVNFAQAAWKKIFGGGGEKISIDIDTIPAMKNISELTSGFEHWKSLAAGKKRIDIETKDAKKNLEELNQTVSSLDADLKDLTTTATGVGKKIADELAIKGLAGITKNDMKAVVHELQAAEPAIRDEGYKSMQGLLDSIARSSPEMAAHGSEIMDALKLGIEQAAALGPVSAAKVMEIINGLVSKYPELKPVADKLGAIITAGLNSVDTSGIMAKIATVGAALTALGEQAREAFSAAAAATAASVLPGRSTVSLGAGVMESELSKLNAAWNVLNKTAIYGWSEAANIASGRFGQMEEGIASLGENMGSQLLAWRNMRGALDEANISLKNYDDQIKASETAIKEQENLIKASETQCASWQHQIDLNNEGITQYQHANELTSRTIASFNKEIEASDKVISGFDKSIETSNKTIEGFNKSIEESNKRVSEYQAAIDRLSNIKITGQAEADEKSFETIQKINKLKLEILRAEKVYNYELAAKLTLQSEELQKQQEIDSLVASTTYDPQLREIQAALDPLHDQSATIEEILGGIKDNQNAIAAETDIQKGLNTKIKEQQVLQEGVNAKIAEQQVLQEGVNAKIAEQQALIDYTNWAIDKLNDQNYELEQTVTRERDRIYETRLELERQRDALDLIKTAHDEAAAKVAFYSDQVEQMAKNFLSRYDEMIAKQKELNDLQTGASGGSAAGGGARTMAGGGYMPVTVPPAGETVVVSPIYLDGREITQVVTRIIGNSASAYSRSGGRY